MQLLRSGLFKVECCEAASSSRPYVGFSVAGDGDESRLEIGSHVVYRLLGPNWEGRHGWVVESVRTGSRTDGLAKITRAGGGQGGCWNHSGSYFSRKYLLV